MAKSKVSDIDAILANIEKNMGHKGRKSPFSKFGNIKFDERTKTVPFGIKAINEASYSNGIPTGKMVEIFGPESSGKSLITLYLIAEAQKMGMETVLLDVEQSFDPVWAAKHGVDVDKLIFSNDFANGESALDYAYEICKTGAFGLVVIDSTAALVPQAELSGSLEDNAAMAAKARLMSRACPKITKACGETETICVFINQVRDNVGVMYGNKETTPGGKALKFYSHMRLRVQGRKKITVKEGKNDVVVGQNSSVTFVKNKTARPFGKCEFKIIFDQKSLNPVVMLCKLLKENKLLSTYKGMFRIKKGTLDNTKNIETGAINVFDLADYVVKNDLTIKLLDALLDELTEDDLKEIDDAVLEMKTNPESIISPNDITDETSFSMETKKVEDATEDEIDEDDDEDDEPEVVEVEKPKDDVLD